MFLITGFGASGTKYTATIFQKLGYDVGHEKEGKDGVVSWKHLTKHEKYGIILHQVRHPLRVIGSAVTGMPRNLNRIIDDFCKHDMPRPVFKNKLHQTMFAYVYWNAKAAKVSKFTYRIEEFDTKYRDVFKAVGLDVPDRLPHVSKSINSHSHKDTYMNLLWDDLYAVDVSLTTDIRDMSLLYGYEI